VVSDEQPDLVKLHVTASLQNFTEALADAEELAWDHAQMAANSAGFSIGSEQFEYIYKHLSKQYKELANYLEFLTMNALVLIRSLLNTQTIALDMDTPVEDTEVATMLGKLSHIIVSSYAWLITSQGLLWPPNGAIDDLSVTFLFPSDHIITTEDEHE
jgi:hypothetical protein